MDKPRNRVYVKGNRWVLELDGNIHGTYLTLDNLMSDSPVYFHGAGRDGDLHFWAVTPMSGAPVRLLSPRVSYERHEDMSPDGKLVVFIEDDGDVIVTIHQSGENIDKYSRASVQFCTYSGGGRSPNVREALLKLAEAILIDNQGER